MKKRTLAHENDWYYNNYIMRLLIVEDENDLRNIVKKRLVKEHYSVDACGDGLEAMAYIDMTSYDGIILDIMLPGKDGYEILRELRQREDDTPVLLLTAKDSIEDRVKGLDLGADDYLIKPFAFEELLARIRVMMRRKPQFTSNQLKIADLIRIVTQERLQEPEMKLIFLQKNLWFGMSYAQQKYRNDKTAD